MPIDWSNFDPQYGQKLGAIFDPAVIAEKQNRLSDLMAGREMQKMQMTQAVEQMNKTKAIQQIMQQTGGDPAKAVQALLAAGHAAEAAQLHSLIPKPKEPEFSKEAGGFAIPPSAQFPSGRIVKPEGYVPTIEEPKKLPPSWHLIETPEGQRLVDANAPESPKMFGSKPSSKGETPYFSPVQTGEGVMAFNARTGRMEPAKVNGKNVIGSQSDPRLQSTIKYSTKAAEEGAATDVKQHETAYSASENINKLNTTINQLKQSNAITGMGADVLKNVERAKVLFAQDTAAGKVVSDTELLDAMLGSDVFPMIQQLGIGARGMDTPAEREFLRSVMTGTLPMNKNTLIKMTEIRRDIAQRAVDRWNNRVNSGELNNYFMATGRTKGTIGNQVNTPKSSSGITTSGW